MKTMLASMKKKNSGIPKDTVAIFEDIIHRYEMMGNPSLGPQCDEEFNDAMEAHLTREQRFWLYEQNGGCKGTGADKERKAFALEHGHKPLAEKLALQCGDRAALHDDGTITLRWGCSHGYYRKAREKNFKPPQNVQAYFERCAGGRLYGLEKTLGVKLKIKSVDTSLLHENKINPVVFTFQIVG